MIVADKIAEWLHEKEITHCFGIIGGGNVVLWDAIHRAGKTKIICCHHEQAAVMAAAYYYRVSGALALALVTTGAGSTNALTGVMAAYMDSIPVLVISGNENSKYMYKPTRVWGVQGYGSNEMAENAVKSGMRAIIPTSAIPILDGLHKLALEHRQGPVWFDIPKDIQGAMV